MSFWSRLLRGSAGDHYHRGIRLFNEGNYDEAGRVLEEIIESGANPFAKLGAFYAAEAHAKLGLANYHRGELERARTHFGIALRENEHYPDLYFYLRHLRRVDIGLFLSLGMLVSPLTRRSASTLVILLLLWTLLVFILPNLGTLVARQIVEVPSVKALTEQRRHFYG